MVCLVLHFCQYSLHKVYISILHDLKIKAMLSKGQVKQGGHLCDVSVCPDEALSLLALCLVSTAAIMVHRVHQLLSDCICAVWC